MFLVFVGFSTPVQAHDPSDDNSYTDVESQPQYDPANDPFLTGLSTLATDLILLGVCPGCSAVSQVTQGLAQLQQTERHPDRPAPDPLAPVHEAVHQSNTANNTDGAPRGSGDDGIADSPQTEVAATVGPFSPSVNTHATYNASIENDIPVCTTETVYEWGVVEEKRDWRGEVYFTVYGHVPAGTVTVCE